MANEQGTAQCPIIARNDMWFWWKTRKFIESSLLERSAKEGDSPVNVRIMFHTVSAYRVAFFGIRALTGGKFHLRQNMSTRLIANKYREGKAKRTLKRELKVLEIVKGEANIAF
jgi:hypothetical protein